jgi:hypothetical protein
MLLINTPFAHSLELFVGLCPHSVKDYGIPSNFWKFYLVTTGLTLRELFFFVKVFRLLRLEQISLGVQSVDTVRRCTTCYLLAGPACLWCLGFFSLVESASCEACLLIIHTWLPPKITPYYPCKLDESLCIFCVLSILYINIRKNRSLYKNGNNSFWRELAS